MNLSLLELVEVAGYCFSGWEGCTLGLGNFFWGGSWIFLVAFWALLLVLYGVSGAVGSCFSVTFYVAKRDV